MTERRTDSTARVGGRGGGRCLLCLPAGHDAPLPLLDGLRTRGVDVGEATDAPGAMLELVTGRAAMLVIVEPRAQRHAQRLVDAARRYVDGLVVWQYAAGDDPPLRAWPDEPAIEPAAAVDTQADEPAEPTKPAERLEPIEPAVITEDELAMLLDDGEPAETTDDAP